MRIQQHLPVFFLFIIQLFDLLPGELRITKVSVTRCLGIDRFAQIELFQNIPHFKAEVALDDLKQLFIALHASAKSVHA